jgi:hypothetical protein
LSPAFEIAGKKAARTDGRFQVATQDFEGLIDRSRFIDRNGGFVAETDGSGVNGVDSDEDNGADGEGEEDLDEGKRTKSETRAPRAESRMAMRRVSGR